MRLWIGIGCLALILSPPLVYRGWLNGKMLRTDPDAIPSNVELMRHAVASGGSQFDVHCATCHGVDGRGDTARGVPDLTDSDWLYGAGAVSEIERTIAYGIRSDNPKAWNLASMPAFATPRPSAANPKIPPLDPAQIHDVVEYLFYLQGRSGDDAAASRGGGIFSGSGACYDCHSPDGRGDPAIGAPNLVDKINLYGDGSRASLWDSIAHGRQGVCPAWIERMSPAALRATAIYTYSLSHRHPAPVTAMR